MGFEAREGPEISLAMGREGLHHSGYHISSPRSQWSALLGLGVSGNPIT